MFRTDYSAQVLCEALTSRENHFPVIANLKWRRKRPSPRKMPPQFVWNTKLLYEPERLSHFQALTHEYLQSNLVEETDHPNKAACTLQMALTFAEKKSIGKVRVEANQGKTRRNTQIKAKKMELYEYRKEHKHKLAMLDATCLR